MKYTDFQHLLLRLLVHFLPNGLRWQEESYSVPVTVPTNPCIDTVLQGKLRTCKYTGKTMRKQAGGEWHTIDNVEFLAFKSGKVSLVRIGSGWGSEEFAEPDEERNFDEED